MAVKAVCTVGSIGRDSSDHTKFYIGINYAALDDSNPAICGMSYLYSMDPNLDGATMATNIEGQMKTFLSNQGISFGILDTVRLLPAAL